MIHLVTGGSGFLGSALVRSLVQRGHQVRVLDDHSRGRRERLPSGVDLVEADLRDLASVRAASVGASVVWHLGAVNGTASFYDEPDRVLEVGVAGTLHVIQAALSCGVRRLVLASSSEVYHRPPIVPTPETVPAVIPDLHNPRFSYAGSKIIGELLALHLARPRGLECVIVRPHNVYGPDMGELHVIPQLARRLATLKAKGDSVLPIEGDGSQTRAFCFVADAAHAIAEVGERAADGSVVNVGREEEVTIADLAKRIARRVGVEVSLQPGPPAKGGTPRRCPDTAAMRALGVEAPTTLDDGLAPTVDWYLTHPPS